MLVSVRDFVRKKIDYLVFLLFLGLNQIQNIFVKADLRQPPALGTKGNSATASLNGKQVDLVESENHSLSKFRLQILLFFGICFLAILGLWIYAFTNLASSGTNPQQRKNYVNMLWGCFIATAGLGALSWLVGLAYISGFANDVMTK